MDADSIVFLACSVIILILNALFSASEIAFLSLNESKYKKLAEEGDKKAQKIIAILEDEQRFLGTFSIGFTSLAFVFSSFAVLMYQKSLVSYINLYITSYNMSSFLSVLIILAVAFLIFLLIGRFIPRRLAYNHADKTAGLLLGYVLFFNKLFYPLYLFFSKGSSIILRIFGIKNKSLTEEVTEEDILMLVDVGNETGVIEESQKDMINNIFEFQDKTAREIMTHRTEVVAFDINTEISEIINSALVDGYSRIPIFEGDIDKIVGIIYVKDLLKIVADYENMKSANLKDFLRPAYFIPGYNRLRALFEEFTDKKLSMAIVIDEYGGTEGIVTMEDILESIVGNIRDEYDNEEEEAEIAVVSENEYTFDGTTPISEIEELFEIKFPEIPDCDTIGGIILNLIGRIPADDETPVLDYEDVRFTVLKITDRRVIKVSAEKFE